MIDFDILAWCVIAAAIVFVTCLAICLIWKKPDEAESKAGKLRKRLLRISVMGLAGVVISMLALPLIGVFVMFFGFPISAVVLLILCLIRFCQVRIMRKKGTDAVRKEDGTALKVLLVLSIVFAAVLVAVLACFIFLPAGAIAFM